MNRFSTKTKYVNNNFHEIFSTTKSNYDGIAVDHDGNVYVSSSFSDPKFIQKYDPDAKVISEFGDLEEFPNSSSLGDGPMLAVDAYKRLYALDWDNGYVVVYSPKESGELIVTVPPDAANGPITVETTSGNTATSVDSFTVLDRNEPVSITEVDITQGLGSYPFVVGKETLIYAKFDGLFGNPAGDSAIVSLPNPNGGFDYEFRFDSYKWDFRNKKTVAYCHIPLSVIQTKGIYPFTIDIRKNGQSLIQSEDMVKSRAFNTTKDINLYFVKFTDVPYEQWTQKDPFPWFDMRTFLYGIETFKRTYPVARSGVNFRFGGGVYIEGLQDGSQKEDEDEIYVETQRILNKSRSKKNPIDRIVALLDSSLRETNHAGFTRMKSEKAVTYFGSGDFTETRAYTSWGVVLIHEIGHTYGLVYDRQSNSDDDKHSINFILDEDHGPVTAWNSVTDKLVNSDSNEAYSVMYRQGGGLDDQYFFESKYNEKTVDYHKLYGKLDTSSVSLSLSSMSIPILSPLSESRKFVISGLIDSNNTILGLESFLTTEELPLTSLEPSDYTLVFLDETGKILSQDGFLLYSFISFGEDDNTNNKSFDLVRPYPDGIQKVEIRFQEQILASIVPSATSPVVSNVIVDVPEFQPVKIQWDADDPDGDALTYSILYSTDNGENFTAIAANLKETRLVWDDSLCPGSENAVIRVVASDGFHITSLDSYRFYLRKKNPQVAIFPSINGLRYTEGSKISIRATAFDPEDGSLSGESLTWILDNNIELGTGEKVSIHELPRKIPLGYILMPLEVGNHSIRLTATDSEGNENSSDFAFEIVADTDRDGFSNQDEEAFGGDPLDPFDRPGDMDEDDDGLLVTKEDSNRNGLVDPSETDPNAPDTDDDGLWDALELGRTLPDSDDTDISAGYFHRDMDPTTQTDPTNPDSDDDTLKDGDEDRNKNGMFDFGETDPNNPDTDGDSYRDDKDNCPLDPNTDQADFDGDLIGDVCDPDIDNDDVLNESDECEFTNPNVVVDPATGCSIDQLCPCEGPMGTTESWRNQGKYVSCVAKTSEYFVEQNLITEEEKDIIVSDAAQSECGNKKNKLLK